MTKDLVERLRSQAFDRYAPKDLLNEAADALQSRIAEVERLTAALRKIAQTGEEAKTGKAIAMRTYARVALSQHRKL